MAVEGTGRFFEWPSEKVASVGITRGEDFSSQPGRLFNSRTDPAPGENPARASDLCSGTLRGR
jgi:hypothetical protein